MKSEEYIRDVLKTESGDTQAIYKRLSDPRLQRMLHGACGAVTESGELMDMLKKHIFYGAPFDTVNVEEELGDLCWYISLILVSLEDYGSFMKWEDIWEKNIAKLKARYGEKFTEEAAVNRDLKKEREILES